MKRGEEEKRKERSGEDGEGRGCVVNGRGAAADSHLHFAILRLQSLVEHPVLFSAPMEQIDLALRGAGCEECFLRQAGSRQAGALGAEGDAEEERSCLAVPQPQSPVGGDGGEAAAIEPVELAERVDRLIVRVHHKPSMHPPLPPFPFSWRVLTSSAPSWRVLFLTPPSLEGGLEHEGGVGDQLGSS